MLLHTIIFPISSLFLAIGFLALGYGMLMTYISIYLKESGSTDVVIGIINAAFFVGAITSSIVSQKIISIVGHIRSFSVFASVMVIAFLCHTIFVNEAVWGLLRFISGFAYYALILILESWLNEKCTDEYRGQILGIYTIVLYLAVAVGQFFLSVESQINYIIFSIGSALVLFSLLVIALTKIKEPSITPFERYSLPKLYNVASLALVGSFIAGVLVSGFFTMMPIYVLEKFNALNTLILFISITIIGGLVAQWPVGKLSDRLGRRKLLAASGVFVFLISSVFILFEESLFVLYLLGFLLGVGIFSVYPLALSRANDKLKDNSDVVEISRALLFSYALGSFIAPLVIGAGYEYIGYDFVFYLFALLGVSLSAYALTRERIPDEELSVFVEMPALSTELLSEMDPRQDQEWVNERVETSR